MSSQIEKFKCPLGYCETMICGELQPVLCPIAIAIPMNAPLTINRCMLTALLQPVRDTDTVLRARRPVLTWLSAGTTCFAGLLVALAHLFFFSSLSWTGCFKAFLRFNDCRFHHSGDDRRLLIFLFLSADNQPRLYGST